LKGSKDRIAPGVLKKIMGVKLLIVDVDGVMTDGRIVYDDDGRQLKYFDVKDGHGIKLFIRAGLEVAIVTSRKSKVVLHRANDLGIKILFQGAPDKVKAFEEIITTKGLLPEDTSYIGDDLIDIPLLKRVGFSVAVADAVREVKGCVDYVTERPGGYGAVREVCELVLRTQERWEGVTERYFL
jgi:3-deoxy-D-manno-octulosonate 8-phosphate phosphatase (KDO 8-P phosphatase)